MTRRRIETAGPEQTESLGAELAATLAPGDVVLVQGELGAGKTTFVRGACRALGVTDPVTSPTFTIGQRYHGRVLVSHLDLYRLGPAPPGAKGAGDSRLPGEEPNSGRQFGDSRTAKGARDSGLPLPGALPGEDPALLADYLTPDTIAFVEWPEGGERALGELARIARRVRLAHAGGDRRTVEIE